MDILFLRHGESEGNAQGRMQGRRDFPLSALGLEQAARAAVFLHGLGLELDAAYVSPLKRARETAEALRSRGICGELTIEEELAEIGAGELEGLSEAEIDQRFPGFMQRPVTRVGDFGEYGGESYEDVQARVGRVRARLEQRHREQAHRVLLVGHGGFNFQLLKTLICEPVPRTCIVKMGNCTMTLVRMRLRRGVFMGEVVWHVPVELMGASARGRVRAVYLTMTTLSFSAGTLELKGSLPEGIALPSAKWDARTQCLRAPAIAYAEIVRALHKANVSYDDAARQYVELEHSLVVHREPRPYQREALRAWQQAKGRGVVVLPTGAGKSHVAVLAIDDKRRSALVVAPTLDLVRQWYDLLRTSFACEVGIVGGGSHEVRPLTVTTYDSACIHMDHFGARFGLVVFDECHHLPGATFSLAAELCLAPFRLGLTATPERSDGEDSRLDGLIGPIVYRKDIVELRGPYLAEYETVHVEVELSPAERSEYESERKIYLEFIRSRKIRMGDPRGWNDFIMRSAQSAEGQRAMRAYRRQRGLSLGARAKLDYVEHLLHAHRGERTLIFTENNATAYEISRRFLVPVITHQTKIKERSEILERFSAGSYGVIATSKVLNEGVDVPDASVAIIISGSGSVREHVQRLGRILRRKGDKFALLYELVSARTGEVFTSERRRDHSAYGGG